MTQRNWIAVASAEHARRGRDHRPLGFMQVGHGKHSPLKRLSSGDRVVYYSPATVFSGTDKLRSFVSIGIVQPGAPYEAEMGNGFMAWRRDVAYLAAHETPIAPLIERLAFIENPKQWGYRFRFGMFDIGNDDMKLIAQAMSADLKTLEL
jgi:hypothetical protein